MKTGNYWVKNIGNHGMLFAETVGHSSNKRSRSGVSNKGVSERRTLLGRDDQWDASSYVVKGHLYAPNGEMDEKTRRLRALNENNHLSAGIITRKIELLWGQGPCLFTYEIVDGERKKKVLLKKDEPEVYKFLKSIDYENLLLKVATDYYYGGGYWLKFIPFRGSYINQKPSLKTLEYVPFEDCKFLLKHRDSYDTAGVIVYDFLNRKVKDPETYNEFNPLNPDLRKQSIGYFGKKSFARKLYNNPSYEGAIDWIERSTAIPKILETFSENVLNIKWHVKIPHTYWEKKRDELMEECALAKKRYNPKMLEDLKDDMIDTLANTFSGNANAGKFLQTDFYYQDKQIVGWILEPMDMKVKEFIESHVNIGKAADIAVAAGMNLHPSLSNIGGTTANSGSEIIQSLQSYLMSGNAIHEKIVPEGINRAIEILFPDKDVFVGFIHSVPQMDSNVTPKKRLSNGDNIQ